MWVQIWILNVSWPVTHSNLTLSIAFTWGVEPPYFDLSGTVHIGITRRNTKSMMQKHIFDEPPDYYRGQTILHCMPFSIHHSRLPLSKPYSSHLIGTRYYDGRHSLDLYGTDFMATHIVSHLGFRVLHLVVPAFLASTHFDFCPTQFWYSAFKLTYTFRDRPHSRLLWSCMHRSWVIVSVG